MSKRIIINLFLLIFALISVLFLLRPILLHFDIFSNPVRAKATFYYASSYKNYIYFKFLDQDKDYHYIKLSREYENQDTVTILYEKNNPENFIVLSLYGLFLEDNFGGFFLYIIFVAMFFSVWSREKLKKNSQQEIDDFFEEMDTE
jgi:hypothetical protein